MRVIDNSYSPPVVRINEGGKVRFNNWGNNPHNVIAVDETWGSYEEIPKGDYLDITYEAEGLYKYLCSFHASPDGEWGMVGSVVVGDINYEDYTNFSKMDVVPSFSGSVRNVPDDYETIQDAVNASNPGDLVLIKPGIYYEEVVVNVPSITIRGWDRNNTIIDGEFAGGAYWGGMDTGLVSLYDLSSDVPSDIADLISQRTDEIIAGDFDPPIVEEEFIDNVIGTVSP